VGHDILTPPIVNVGIKLKGECRSETFLSPDKGYPGELHLVEDSKGMKYVLVKDISYPIQSSREWNVFILMIGVVPIPIPIPGKKEEQYAALNLLIDPSKIIDIDEMENTIRIKGTRKLVLVISSQAKGYPSKKFKEVEVSLHFREASKMLVSRIYALLVSLWLSNIEHERRLIEMLLERMLKGKPIDEKINYLTDFIIRLDNMAEDDNISPENLKYFKNKCKKIIAELLQEQLKEIETRTKTEAEIIKQYLNKLEELYREGKISQKTYRKIKKQYEKKLR